MSGSIPKEAEVRFSRDFDSLLTDVVDEVFERFFGKSSGAVYYHLTLRYRIKRRDIPSDLNGFSDGLRGIFKEGGLTIERAIVKEVYLRAGVSRDFTRREKFSTQIQRARKHYIDERWRRQQQGE